MHILTAFPTVYTEAAGPRSPNSQARCKFRSIEAPAWVCAGLPFLEWNFVMHRCALQKTPPIRNPGRSNLDSFGLQLSPADVARIDGLDGALEIPKPVEPLINQHIIARLQFSSRPDPEDRHGVAGFAIRGLEDFIFRATFGRTCRTPLRRR